jgi:hypothetical protein
MGGEGVHMGRHKGRGRDVSALAVTLGVAIGCGGVRLGGRHPVPWASGAGDALAAGPKRAGGRLADQGTA